jgi:prolipoprotein diacylglyceryltransferase
MLLTPYIVTFVILFALLIAIWTLPRRVQRNSQSTSRWNDLRIWASILVVLQALIYVVFIGA